MRQKILLLTAVAVARVSVFTLVPRASVPTGLCERAQVMPTYAVDCFTGEEP